MPTANPSGAINLKNGGLSFPVGIAAGVKPNSSIWVANQGNDSATEVRIRGSRPAAAANFRGSGLDSPSAIAIDHAGNAWVTNFYGQSVTALTPSGVPVPASGSPFTGGGLDGPAAIAVDGAGNIWVANFHGASVTVLAGTKGGSTGTPISGPSGYEGAGLDGAAGLAVDPSGNVWVANFNNSSITEFVGAAAPVRTPIR
jgi:DNA-binding beta-propeller fold protein YncE